MRRPTIDAPTDRDFDVRVNGKNFRLLGCRHLEDSISMVLSTDGEDESPSVDVEITFATILNIATEISENPLLIHRGEVEEDVLSRAKKILKGAHQTDVNVITGELYQTDEPAMSDEEIDSLVPIKKLNVDS